MKNISGLIDNAITTLLLGVAFFTPLFFLNQTTEFYEMPKLILLVVATLILLGLWILSWIFKGKIVIVKTPLDIPLLILLGTILASTFFSVQRYNAIYGNFPTVHGSTIAWVTYILLYFVTVSHLRSVSRITSLLYALYASGIVVAVISLLSFFRIYLPFDFAQAVNFTPTGSSFSTIALLLVLLPLPLLSITFPNKYFSIPVALAITIVFSVTIALIGSLPTYIALLIAFSLCLYIASRGHTQKTLPLLVVPLAVTLFVIVFAYVPFPGNVLHQAELNFPKEIQLPFNISWKISLSAFRDAPFIGTGPSSYLFNFTAYKPIEFNALNVWNFSFDRAYNEFLQVLGTLGLLGTLTLIFISFIVIMRGWKNIFPQTHDSDEDAIPALLPSLSISALLTIVLLAIHATTLVSLVVTLFILAAFMMAQKSIRNRVLEISMGLRAATTNNRHFDLLPIIIFIVYAILAAPALYKTYTVVAADYYHRQALLQANKNGTLTYQYLQKAETLNPHIDLYRVDMAQTNFALANALATKAITDNTPLSDQDKSTIQTLLSQAINEGRTSVQLSPQSSRNLEVLASIYRGISGVANNALSFALDAYGQAVQRDPLNPTLRLNIGGIYYSVQNYDLAIRFFADAANLKPDYVTAYYNLSIALRDKGDLQNAVLVAQQTVSLLQKNPNSADYKTATQLLADLKAKVAEGTTTTTQQPIAPAAQNTSALQNANVSNVNVSNLNNPPQVTPPPAVSANPNTRLSVPTPSTNASLTPQPSAAVTPTP